MALELDSKYDHKSVEKKWLQVWEEAEAFRPEFTAAENPDADQNPFCIVIPPPNVTGDLHVGHALDQTVQDVLTRTARKQGRSALWLPGMDHAGIAVQVRVEKNLQAEGTNRHELGREKFLERVWDWKHQSGGAIKGQQRLMGFSLDWSRERFTMDEGLSKAVRKVFVDLYNEGLIYRDTRMVNWDPVAHTVLSDLEVEYDENYKGELYSFAYPLSEAIQTDAGEVKEIVVATTRPETMLGDTAIAVHPKDPRYKALIGKSVDHPLLPGRKIPIIGDDILVDMEFGTGAVKVTPAHDMNDYETGKRHDLEFITIFDESARINENGGKFEGQDRYQARKSIKAALAELGLDRGTEDHMMSVGKSQRSSAIVEPIVSTQWFAKAKVLAEPAIKAVESGEVEFVPKTWENTYFRWMREIRDWCISRQLWWGHRIPAWYGPDGHLFVADNEGEAQAAAEKHYGKSVELTQDEDVLDTWFSSGLWPFSTMGWPDQTEDLKRYYPTSVLVTGFDIIFFWVARMMMLGLHFMKEPPFKQIYIHGLLRDENGQKMSKTKGNVVDPLEAVEKYGADAFRFFLMATLAEGKDSSYSEQRLKGYQNFANKIWNSSRFVLMNLPEGFEPQPDKLLAFAAQVEGGESGFQLEAEDWWILSELRETVQETERTLAEYKFHIATDRVYTFAWRLFCDWYIEFIKPRIFGKAGEESAEAARQTVFYVLRNMLGLLNPFMPFLTEELYEYLGQFQKPQTKNEKLLISADWPTTPALPAAGQGPTKSLQLLQEVINATRTIRSEMGIAPDQKVKIVIRTTHAGLAQVSGDKALAIERLAKTEGIRVEEKYESGKFDAMETFSEGEVYLPLEGVLDIEKETKRLQGELKKLKGVQTGIDKKLSSDGFRQNAPPEVIEKEKQKLSEITDKVAAIQTALKRFSA
ncbi:MAG: valine--tRNA ligase [bacterium]|nr:valine--tRNA ligase [bacterium]